MVFFGRVTNRDLRWYIELDTELDDMDSEDDRRAFLESVGGLNRYLFVTRAIDENPAVRERYQSMMYIKFGRGRKTPNDSHSLLEQLFSLD
ncbi:hypothetical protein HYV88_03170 [Candidatus Woesearchaeota archaeon]|nr:hypothetical protein [Candidatus Woesearchaeota archaeon]